MKSSQDGCATSPNGVVGAGVSDSAELCLLWMCTALCAPVGPCNKCCSRGQVVLAGSSMPQELSAGDAYSNESAKLPFCNSN
jgi:hypothetical protein